jgi:type I restriction enzyme S subunit
MSNKTEDTSVTAKARRSLVPALRFPEFRDAGEWEEVYGNNLFKQVNDRNHEQDLPVLAITQENGAIPRDLINYHVTVTEKSIENYKVVQIGDFIVSLRSFQGGIEYSPYHGICSPAYVVLRRLIEGSDVYFKHYFKTERFISLLTRNLEGLRDGKMISYRQFSELMLPVPKPSEQQKIADCLSSIDDLIALEAQKLEALKAHKKGLMQQLFPSEGETIPKLRFPEFRDAEGWEDKKLGDLSKILRGGSPRPIEDYLASDANGLNWLKIGDVDQNSKYITHTREKVVMTALGKTREVNPGDLIMSNSMSFGRPYILKIKACIHDGWIVVTDIAKKIDANYLYYLILSPVSKLYFLNNAAGAVVQNLNVDIVKLLPVYFPSFEEQQKIADCLASIDDLIALQSQKLESLKAHKKGLMQQLFPVSNEVRR